MWSASMTSGSWFEVANESDAPGERHAYFGAAQTEAEKRWCFGARRDEHHRPIGGDEVGGVIDGDDE